MNILKDTIPVSQFTNPPDEVRWYDWLTFGVAACVACVALLGQYNYSRAHWKVQEKMRRSAAMCILLLSDKYYDDQGLLDYRVNNAQGRYKIP